MHGYRCRASIAAVARDAGLVALASAAAAAAIRWIAEHLALAARRRILIAVAKAARAGLDDATASPTGGAGVRELARRAAVAVC